MYRQGEVEIFKTKKVKGKMLPHKVIAEGETTGHKHEIIGEAELYEKNGVLYLSAKEEVEIIHPEHKAIRLPKGNYQIEFQREYEIGEEEYKRVRD